MGNIGVVVIGRNEGERLKVCLQSVLKQAEHVVYVDSGSFDGSVEYAASVGVDIVQLDMRVPFSAGRARNEGFYSLVERYPGLRYVQFIDGDCELVNGWITVAHSFLQDNHSYAIVAGRRKERYPEKTIYNALCDIEWDTPIGEAKSCGGDCLVRVTAFQEEKGFNPAVVAGEEPELCYRLRKKGFGIFRIDSLMTLHDAEITKFSQWWKRAVRSGHAYAQGLFLHGTGKEHFRLKESLRIWLWGLAIPLAVFSGTLLFSPWWFIMLLSYPLQFAKIYLVAREKIAEQKITLIFAGAIVVDKWPQLWGQLIFFIKRIFRQPSTIIEYK